MASRVFLHIGLPKTGTTYIQDLLSTHQPVLAAAGVHQPTTERVNVFAAAADLTGSQWRGKRGSRDWTWRRVAREAKGTPDVFVVSQEMLASAATEQVAVATAAFGAADVHVILTVRDLARQIPSVWQQDVKYRESRRYSDFCRGLALDTDPFWDRQDAAAIAARWADHVPTRNIHIVTVPPAGADPELLWDRFATVLSLEDVQIDAAAAPKRNPAFGAVQAELLRRINGELGDRIPAPQPYTRIVRFGLVPLVPTDDSVPFGIPAELEGWLTERSNRMVAELARPGYDVVGDLEDLAPALATTPGPDDVTDANVASLSVQTIANLLERHSRLQTELVRLRKWRRGQQRSKHGK